VSEVGVLCAGFEGDTLAFLSDGMFPSGAPNKRGTNPKLAKDDRFDKESQGSPQICKRTVASRVLALFPATVTG